MDSLWLGIFKSRLDGFLFTLSSSSQGGMEESLWDAVMFGMTPQIISRGTSRCKENIFNSEGN